MKLIRRVLAVGLAIATTVVAACSNSSHQTGSSGPVSSGMNGGGSDIVGDVGLHLTLPGGEHISNVNYVLSNTTPFGQPGNNTFAGMYNISKTATLSFTIGSVSAGTGYGITLSAVTDDGADICSFPAPGDPIINNITVVNRTTTVVNVNLQCTPIQGMDAGSVVVNASTFNCPVWNTIVANPFNITLDAGQNVNDSGTLGATAVYPGTSPVTAVIQDGQQLVLVGAATAPSPSLLTFNWSTTGGTLSSAAGTNDPNSTDAGITNQTIFTCPAAPNPTTTFTVTLTLNDGPLPDGGTCDTKFTTGTVQIQCVNPGLCGGAPFATTNTYQAGLCTGNGNSSLVDSNGAPWVPSTTTAVAPDGGTVFCCVPACSDKGNTVAQPVTATWPSGASCTGSDAGSVNNMGCCGPLSPCTTPQPDGGTPQCVTCQYNSSQACTVQEQHLVQIDIAKGLVTGAGPDSNTAACYNCAAVNSCIDSDIRHQAGFECGDVAGSFTNGSGAMVNFTTTCQTTADCATPFNPANNKCALNAQGITFCYCGTGGGGSSSACTGNGASVNGPCLSQEVNGFKFVQTDASHIVGNFTDVTEPSGQANQFLSCALANSCTNCLQ